jgi:hypothetical protein
MGVSHRVCVPCSVRTASSGFRPKRSASPGLTRARNAVLLSRYARGSPTVATSSWRRLRFCTGADCTVAQEMVHQGVPIPSWHFIGAGALSILTYSIIGADCQTLARHFLWRAAAGLRGLVGPCSGALYFVVQSVVICLSFASAFYARVLSDELSATPGVLQCAHKKPSHRRHRPVQPRR